MAKILGFSHEYDSGIAFLKDGLPDGSPRFAGEAGKAGDLIYAANEERFNREKITQEIPAGAYEAGRMMFPEFIKNIDAIAISTKLHISKTMHLWVSEESFLQRLSGTLSFFGLDRWLFGTNYGVKLTVFGVKIIQFARRAKLCKLFQSWNIRAPIIYVDHHLSHAASAYYTAPWDKALVVTLDSQGDGLCSSIYIGGGGRLKKLHSIPFFHSPGTYYLYVTLMLGFKPGQEGKITGLAGYGDFLKTLPIFQSRIIFDSATLSFINKGFYRWREINYLKKALGGFSREDIAAGVQRHLEDLVTSYIREAVKRFADPHKTPPYQGGDRGGVNLALAGGVFANVQLNKKIMELPEVSGIYIYPHMGDGGLAAGAAMALEAKARRLENLYLGPEITPSNPPYFKGDEKTGAPLKVRGAEGGYETRQLSCRTAKLLASGKTVAICRGRMEYGPRALGNRSILAEAHDKKINNLLNKKLRRSEFMPFAPILRKEHLAEYFIGYEKCEKALEFMTIALDATEKCKKEFPAIIHIDGTARPQVVSLLRSREPKSCFLYDLLAEYEKLTGKKILINTSFNMHEEPIVCTPEDAMRAFKESELDALILEDSIIEQ